MKQSFVFLEPPKAGPRQHQVRDIIRNQVRKAIEGRPIIGRRSPVHVREAKERSHRAAFKIATDAPGLAINQHKAAAYGNCSPDLADGSLQSMKPGVLLPRLDTDRDVVPQ